MKGVCEKNNTQSIKHNRYSFIQDGRYTYLQIFYDKKFVREKKAVQIFLDFHFFFEMGWHQERSQKF